MKTKNLVWMYILTLAIGTIFSLYIPKQQESLAAGEMQVIPDEAIRLRILANSDSEEDQAVKRKIRDRVNEEITLWVQDLTSLGEARTTIRSGLPQLQQIAEEVMAAEGLDQTVQVDFEKVEFPTKLYGQFLYPAGEYEAILITLGEGKGANWWCVLYPPLCFLDFSSGTAVQSPGFEGKAEASTLDKEETDKEEVEEVPLKTVEDTQKPVENLSEEKPVASEKIDQQEPVEKEEPVKEQQVKEEIGNLTTENVKDEEKDEKVKEKDEVEKNEAVEKDEKSEKSEKDPHYVGEEDDEVEVRFFVLDVFKGIFN
jgi:stage II sporulation protein R